MRAEICKATGFAASPEHRHGVQVDELKSRLVDPRNIDTQSMPRTGLPAYVNINIEIKRVFEKVTNELHEVKTFVTTTLPDVLTAACKAQIEASGI